MNRLAVRSLFRTLASPKVLALGNKKKNLFFLLYFSRFFVPLPPQKKEDNDEHIKLHQLEPVIRGFLHWADDLPLVLPVLARRTVAGLPCGETPV